MADDPRLSTDCRRSASVRGVCDTCGKTCVVTHMPLHLNGWFCGEHCSACRPDGGKANVPSQPRVIAAGKFAGSVIAELSDDDLREAEHEAFVSRDPMLAEIRAERRLRRAAHGGERFTKRQQSAYRRRWGVVTGISPVGE
jgi:hypothetical protein